MSLPPPRYTLPSLTARARSSRSHSSPKLSAELIRQLKRLATMRKRSRFTETTRSAVSKSLKRITSALTKQSIGQLARVSALAKTSARIGVPKEFRSTFATCRARCNAAASATPGSSPKRITSHPGSRTQLAMALCWQMPTSPANSLGTEKMVSIFRRLSRAGHDLSLRRRRDQQMPAEGPLNKTEQSLRHQSEIPPFDIPILDIIGYSIGKDMLDA